MAKAESAKEEIGWLKVAFAVNKLLVILASVVAAGLSAYVAWIKIVAYRKIRELKIDIEIARNNRPKK